MAWLPENFVHPMRVSVCDGHRLRPIRASDVDLDYPAVMGSRARSWARYGEAWGWPPASMTFEEDREDLVRHEREIEAHESFNYALFDEAETALVGCVYVDPPDDGTPSTFDAVVSWWVVDEAVGTPVEAALDAVVPRWLDQSWPFSKVLHSP